ncbi:AAA family ATPase [Sphingobium baderi]|uniref:Chromosome partitioning protein ParA n=2 Tax=Sphingomonadaceae TaxID=41297 RepID=A0A0S3F6D7_9SPHN|nr:MULTISPECIES: AAA family ATPase [Sphingomonadaceae]ALR23200.1 chromosome partitioning protein ParA [Sphingobium baderi]
MPVITMLSPKGGVGKTTTALLLATELAATGAGVVLIDADPNFPLAKWASLPGKPDNIEVIQEIDEDGIIDTIDAAQKRAQFVIVDLEGRASARVTNALLMTHLALVPLQGSVLDSDQAARAFQSIRRASTAARREIAFAAVYTRTPASTWVRSRVAQSIVQNIEAAGITALPTPIAERTAFKALFAAGGTLATLEGVSSIDKARENAAAFAADVLGRLQEGKGKAA